MNAAVTTGILHGFANGLLTSTSLLANAPSAEQAIADWKQLDRDRGAGRLLSLSAREKLDDDGSPFDLGVHLNLTQGQPLTGSRYPAELLDDRGCFPGIGRLFWRWTRGVRQHRGAVENELSSQVAFLADHNLRPTHLNGHQYVELLPGMAEIVQRLCKLFAIPVVRVAHEDRLWNTTVLQGGIGQVSNWLLAHVKRHFAAAFRERMRRAGLPHPEKFYGTSHAGRVDISMMSQFLTGEFTGRMVEVGLHPGVEANGGAASETAQGWDDPLGNVRPAELSLLSSSELVGLLESQHWRLGRLTWLAN